MRTPSGTSTRSACASCAGESLSLPRGVSQPRAHGSFEARPHSLILILILWYLLLLRSHMQISEIDRRVLGIEKKTLDDIRKEMIAHKQDEERQAVKQLRAVEAEERQTRIELSEATGAYVKQSLKTRLSALATTISSYKKDIANYRATLAYFESIIPQVSVSLLLLLFLFTAHRADAHGFVLSTIRCRARPTSRV